jgi:hypothetical protein
MTELVARTSLNSLGMADRVRVIDQPLTLTSLHVLVAKTHPHARTILYYVNSSLAKLRESGEYEKIVERHLAKFWESQAGAPNPAIGATPAKPAAPKAAAPSASTTPAPTTAPATAPAAPSLPAPTSTAKTETTR